MAEDLSSLTQHRCKFAAMYSHTSQVRSVTELECYCVYRRSRWRIPSIALSLSLSLSLAKETTRYSIHALFKDIFLSLIRPPLNRIRRMERSRGNGAWSTLALSTFIFIKFLYLSLSQLNRRISKKFPTFHLSHSRCRSPTVILTDHTFEFHLKSRLWSSKYNSEPPLSLSANITQCGK